MPLCWAVSVPRACATPTPPASEPQRRRRRRASKPKPPSPRAGGLLNVLDDLTEKQFGRGTLYYGKREAQPEAPPQPDEFETLKSDPVLVAGGTGKTGQWIVLGLLNNGFNVRVLTRSFERAEAIFGESGYNVDVFEGSLDDPASLADAVGGCIAVVSAAGSPGFWRKRPDAANLARAAVDADVRRFVLVSDEQRDAEQVLARSRLPYVVVHTGGLTDKEGGLCTVEFERSPTRMSITRLDLAQVVCQALVHDRFVREMAVADPDGAFTFPSCTINVHNGTQQFVPDAAFWRDRFTAVSEALGVAATVPAIDE